jgi:hypothetical protein
LIEEQTHQLEEARKELAIVRQLHQKLKTTIDRVCPPEKLDLIVDLVRQNDELAYRVIKLKKNNRG